MSANRFALYISILSLFTVVIIAFKGFQKDEPTVINKKAIVPPIGFVNAKTIPLPESIDFAGEAVPLNIPDVKERLDKELHINSYWHNNTIFLLKRAHRWFPVIEPILKENSIPEDFKYLALIESGFENVRSYAGAEGFWQIMKGTAKEYGLEVSKDVDERYHPQKATQAACDYLNWAHNKLGSWTLVAASYNRGVRGISNALENQKAEDYYSLMLNEETYRYVFRILAIKQIFSNPNSYGFDIQTEHLYKPYNYAFDTVRNSIDLVDYALAHNMDYKTLKIYNPWLRDEKLRVGRNVFYVFSLPESKK
jgi:hypothetical protein